MYDLNVCAYMCVHCDVHMCVLCVCWFAHHAVHDSVSAQTNQQRHVLVHDCVCVMCVCVRECVCMGVCVRACVCTYASTYVCVHVVWAYVHVCIHVRVHVGVPRYGVYVSCWVPYTSPGFGSDPPPPTPPLLAWLQQWQLQIL